MAIELALTPDRRWGLGADAVAVAARAAGFDAIGLGAREATAGAAAACAAAGVRCHDVIALVVTDDAEATAAHAARFAAAAATVGAPWVLTVFEAGPTAATAATVQRCAAILAEAGVRMAVEFSPLGPVDAIAPALDLVEAAGADRAGLVIDTWHFFHGPSTFEDLAAVPLDRIAYLQFDDALALGSDDLLVETMNRRTFPGDGVLDLERFAATLLERGWEGTVSVEVLNPSLADDLPLEDWLRRAHDTTARHWG